MRVVRPWILAFCTLCVAGCGDDTMATRPPVPVPDLHVETFGDGGVAAPSTAVVTTSSLMMGGGGALNTVKLADKSTTLKIDTTLDQDNVVRAAGRTVYVIDRSHGTLRVYVPDATSGLKLMDPMHP